MKKNIKFNELCLADKALIINEFGSFIESLQHYDCWLHLYSLHDNFIEIYYHLPTKQIIDIKLIDYTALDKYMSHIVLNLK